MVLSPEISRTNAKIPLFTIVQQHGTNSKRSAIFTILLLGQNSVVSRQLFEEIEYFCCTPDSEETRTSPAETAPKNVGATRTSALSLGR
jgi:hypothetical protein